MNNVPQIAEAMQRVLVEEAEAAARSSGFVQRRSKMTASLFAQTLVFGWMDNPEATLEELAQVAAALGLFITPQGLDGRFSQVAASLMNAVLNTALSQVVVNREVASMAVLDRFNGLYICDSTVISLPSVLAALWPGLGNNRGQATASLKVQLRLNFSNGELDRMHLGPGREQDRHSPVHRAPLPRGALRLADLGYFDLVCLADYDAHGVYFLSRLRVGTCLYDEAGQQMDLLHWLSHQGSGPVDENVYLGQSQRLACRLLACRVPQEVADQRRRRIKEDARVRQKAVNQVALKLAEWTVLVTNAPGHLLSLAEALVLLRIRWQIELLFKLWKSHGRVDESRSRNPWRVLCEVYSKLVCLIIQHWILLTACWRFPDRSLTKAIRTVQAYARFLAAAFAQSDLLALALTTITRCLSVGCRLNKRQKYPSSFQLLLSVSRRGLA